VTPVALSKALCGARSKPDLIVEERISWCSLK
jgi:hypothetical protein